MKELLTKFLYQLTIVLNRNFHMWFAYSAPDKSLHEAHSNLSAHDCIWPLPKNASIFIRTKYILSNLIIWDFSFVCKFRVGALRNPLQPGDMSRFSTCNQISSLLLFDWKINSGWGTCLGLSKTWNALQVVQNTCRLALFGARFCSTKMVFTGVFLVTRQKPEFAMNVTLTTQNLKHWVASNNLYLHQTSRYDFYLSWCWVIVMYLCVSSFRGLSRLYLYPLPSPWNFYVAQKADFAKCR